MKNRNSAIFMAVLAAALYALNAPVSKLLLSAIPEKIMAALLYLGAGLGMALVRLIQNRMGKPTKELPLTRKDLPYTIGMVALDIAAPIFLMMGLSGTTAANASLLNNFEIVATSIIALAIFRERVSRRLWVAIGLVTLSSLVLSFEDVSSFSFSVGSVFVLLACVCWGFENNCTRMLSNSDPLEIVVVKGFGSGVGALIVALISGESFFHPGYILCALALGFVAYGLSIFCYIHAQRHLGAAKTSAYYALAPFIGVAMSLLIFREVPGISFVVGLVIMILGTYFASTDSVEDQSEETR